MSIRTIRQRASEALMRTGTELAIDQRELETRLAAASHGDAAFSSAHGAVALARWANSAILWLAWRIHPRSFLPTQMPLDGPSAGSRH
jgi:hypothetical protein